MAVRSLKTKKGKSATSKATAREVLERYISVLEELTPGETEAIKSTVTQLTEKIYPPPTFHAPATCLKLKPMTVPPARLCAQAGATAEGKVAEQKINLCNCVGAACHLWQFEAGTDPATGDCALNIAAQGSSATAYLLNRMFASQAAQAGQAQGEAPQN